MKKLGVIFTILICGSPLPALPHQPMNNECIAPARPADDQNDLAWQEFLGRIEAFQTCVSSDVERHQNAVSAHQNAARQAVDSWNQFVRSSLNVPEDFPWPPEDG